jgi:hypothetical protein
MSCRRALRLPEVAAVLLFVLLHDGTSVDDAEWYRQKNLWPGARGQEVVGWSLLGSGGGKEL